MINKLSLIEEAKSASRVQKLCFSLGTLERESTFDCYVRLGPLLTENIVTLAELPLIKKIEPHLAIASTVWLASNSSVVGLTSVGEKKAARAQFASSFDRLSFDCVYSSCQTL